MDEKHWNRIADACRMLGRIHQVEVPQAMLRATGNPWQRNAQRRAALKDFLAACDLSFVEVEIPTPHLADIIDGEALQAMGAQLKMPERDNDSKIQSMNFESLPPLMATADEIDEAM